MTRLRGTLAAVVAYACVTIALWSWAGFVTDPTHYRLPLLVIGGTVVLSGIVARLAGLQRWVVPPVQLAIGLMATCLYLAHSPIPLGGGSRALLSQAITDAHTTISRGYPPVPVRHGIAALVLPGGMLGYWLTDVLVCSVRRSSLAGLSLLAIFAAELSAGDGVPWPEFVLAAIGYLTLLALQQEERVAHWGRRLDEHARWPRPGAMAIGASATVVALAVPFAVPTAHLDFSGWGRGHDKGPITVTNPMVGMYGDLRQQKDTPLVTVQVVGGQKPATAPEYLKIAVLNQFNGSEWSTGDRQIPTDQRADGQSLPVPDGAPLTPHAQTTYALTATDAFESRWLPVFDFPLSVTATGDWRYDTDDYDVIAADKDLSTKGLSWSEQADPLQPTQSALAQASATGPDVPTDDLALPPDLPGVISTVAQQVAGAEDTPLQKAAALQQWFLQSGGFTYSLQRPGNDSSADLASFITSNKVGYCQQFATAMAVMARTLDIPARVDVGFLHSTRQPDGSYVFKGGDMHAWPELWFSGIGWVRFDPTPGVGAVPPAYSQNVVGSDTPKTQPNDDYTPPSDPKADTTAPRQTQRQQKPEAPQPETVSTSTTTSTGHSLTWVWVGIGVAVLVLLAAAPWWVRRRRRAQRLDGDAEAIWAELRDTARDLEVPWATGESPRNQGAALHRYVDTVDGRESLDRMVLALERSRYAPDPVTEPMTKDARAVIAGMEAAVPRGTRRAARMLPRSVLGRGGEGRRREDGGERLT
jgi:transglutaminase-like putative cysteine protease